MAEFVLLDLVEKMGLSDKFQVDSAGTSTEELGNPIHPGTVKKLQSEDVPFTQRKAVQLTEKDYNKYDWLLCMDDRNIENTLEIISDDPQNKVKKLLHFSENPRDIDDPWFTGNFDQTYNDVLEGCECFLKYLI
jgi:protein-tyrosine phosphatase